MLGALALVMALMFFLLYFLKYINKRFQPYGDDLIKIISSKNIHPKKQLTLIKISDTFLLLGSTDTQITLLHKFDDQGFEKILGEKIANEKK
jgi:flagellar biosynthetic protein FliO